MITIKNFIDKTIVRASYLDKCPKCEKQVIPGLDAVMCEHCCITWRDNEETEKFYARKKQGAFH